MSARSSSVLSNYRYILRYMGSLPSGASSSESSLRANIIAQFRRGAIEEDEKQVVALREAAHSYVTMVSSVKELTRLRELDSGEKLNPRDKVRATAGRVGLSVPKFADEFEAELALSKGDGQISAAATAANKS